MISKKLHIISFDVPFPADYGGAIDVFYRVVALHKLGYKITLHCFEYGRGKQEELNKYCEQVYYYKRKKFSAFFAKEPFIVASRKSTQLLANLQLDDAPILFEGLHTCAFLNNKNLKKRLKIARTHNIEHDYYAELAKTSKGWRKLFFQREAKKLQKFEPILAESNHILAIQQNDVSHFKSYSTYIKPVETKKVHLLTASMPKLEMEFNPNTEEFCLFHGNLSVVENENALMWIIGNITFPKGLLFVVAGKNPSSNLKSICAQLEVELIANPSDEEMQNLIQSARIHLLYTEQATGLKLKLLNALSSSGHVLLNDKMIAGTNLEELCILANSPEEYSEKLNVLMEQPLSEDNYKQREIIFQEQFNTENNCKRVFDLIN
ncbi:MAG TPA: hypothetical protein EYG86_04810 [Crocinitomicaceae bacterium]|nr:hypothetical protein [Crocinitomicaceae bacterium]